MRPSTRVLPTLLCLTVAAAACSGSRPAAPAPAAHTGAVVVPDSIRAVVDAPDRTAADRALDAGRHPAEMLAFFGIKPGMRVAEIGAAGGYTSELLARTVGPTGVVYAQNSPAILKRFAEEPWSARLATPPMKNVVRVDREFDDPLPPEARNLDAVLIILFYHDTVWLGADRGKMNRAVYDALRPGGIYGIIDHSARPGTGHGRRADAAPHRREPTVVRKSPRPDSSSSATRPSCATPPINATGTTRRERPPTSAAPAIASC
jgi:predicted methyltransferase